MRDDLLNIAATWSFWDRAIPTSVPRSVELPAKLSNKTALVVQGVRRCGKSTLLTQLIEHYRLSPADCAFLNFEDPRLANDLEYPVLDALVAQFESARPNARRRYYFLDEIQWVDGWQRWLRSQLDRPGASTFVITGSNASLLSGELASSLTGRHLEVALFPFDLVEARAHAAALSVEDYLHAGGFPEPLDSPDGDRLRRQYLSDILERDVRERVGARSSRPLRQMVQMLFESAGSETSLRRIAAATGVAVETAASYVDACEDAYLLFGCPYFAFSERKRAHRNRKFYPIDPGLRRIAVTPAGQDRGKSLECAVFIALRRRFKDVCYWRGEGPGKGEVDFVVGTTDGIVPIQVTWGEAEERHHAALDLFYEAHPHALEAVLVSAENFDTALDALTAGP